ncbi:oxidoreductase-like domain-containing protein [Chitinibacteraceae bacterium HSL-7]
MTEHNTESDPRPEAPHEPELEACCGSGCQPCIFDLYAEELHIYRRRLTEWLARHPEEKP